MVEFRGVGLATHLTSIVAEYASRGSIYGYPRRKFYLGFPPLDFSVVFHEQKAATPLGPASGPHTQMAQNIVLSFLGGARIIELKTVQVLDRLKIPRPCIDARNVCFNVEWSQELTLEESYQEYVTAWVLLKLLEKMELLGIPSGNPFYHTIFDLSVGYDFQGISSERISQWIRGMTNAQPAIESLLATLPDQFAQYQRVSIDPQICKSVTLSTFHGCPPEEIEAIVQYMIREHLMHVTVKMNPTLLGYEAVAQTLHDDLGFRNLELVAEAFDHDLKFEQAVAMMKRLERFSAQYQRKVGAKFSNTLVVKNNQGVFSEPLMYLSGAPLHVLAMKAMVRFRQEMGEHFPISFSAGINQHNFADAVLCNLKPITVCTDLLQVGSYTRLFDYLQNLKKAMEASACQTIELWIRKTAGEGHSLTSAGLANAQRLASTLSQNPRYHYEMNRQQPPKKNTQLAPFDCLTCDKCLSVCPNAANFTLTIEPHRLPTTHYHYRKGEWIPLAGEDFVLAKRHQIANLVDFCNECGNCDVFCSELGSPFRQKPRFFIAQDSYVHDPAIDGFYFPTPFSLTGRIARQEYSLCLDPVTQVYTWRSPQAEMQLNAQHQLLTGKILLDGEMQEIDMMPYYLMRALLDGILQNPQSYPAVILRKCDSY